MTWILILFAYVGPFGKGNSNALTSIAFNTKDACEVAGKESVKLAKDTVKEIRFVCVAKG